MYLGWTARPGGHVGGSGLLGEWVVERQTWVSVGEAGAPPREAEDGGRTTRHMREKCFKPGAGRKSRSCFEPSIPSRRSVRVPVKRQVRQQGMVMQSLSSLGASLA